MCHELIRNISLSSIHNVHGNYSQWSRHLTHSQDSEFRVSSVRVAFMMGRVAVGQVFSLNASVFPPVNTLPSVLHTLINLSITYTIQHYQLTTLFISILTVNQYEWTLVSSEVRCCIAQKINMQMLLRNLLLHQQGKLYTTLVKEVLITKNITNSNHDMEMKLK